MTQKLCPNILFEQAAFIEANNIPNVVAFSWSQNRKKASAQFSIANHVAVSLPKTPYCGLCISENLTLSESESMTHALIDFGNEYNLKNLIVKQRPYFYENLDQQSTLHSALSNLGFASTTEINHHVNLENINEIPLHKMQQRKIKKCMNEGFVFQQEPVESTADLYSFIAKAREAQGLQINISFDQLIKLVKGLNHQFQLFSVRSKEGELAACTVVVLVNSKIVYNYLPAFDRHFATTSPMTLLQFKLYQHFSFLKYEHLDLGISSIHGVPQETLLSFKEKMGGIHSSRFTYQFDFQDNMS